MLKLLSFREYFNEGRILDFKGELIGSRDKGCRYDFKFARNSRVVFEVKGLSSEGEGVSFTVKKWSFTSD